MAMLNGPRKVRQYTAEFKLKAVKLSQIEGVRVQNVADALEIHPFMLSNMLSKWRKQVRERLIKVHVSIAPAKLAVGWVERSATHHKCTTEPLPSGKRPVHLNL